MDKTLTFINHLSISVNLTRQTRTVVSITPKHKQNTNKLQHPQQA